MVAYTFVQRLTPNVALVAAAGIAVLIALGMVLLPGDLLEELVVRSGVAAFVPAAEPPLGVTARICAGVFAGGGVGLVLWFLLSTLADLVQARHATGPAIRRADAHPDAPPREPLRAGRDFGFDLDMSAPQTAVDPLAPAPLPEPVIAMARPPEPLTLTQTAKPAEPAVAPPPPVQPLPFDLDQPLAAFDPAAIPDSPMVPPPPVAPLRRKRPHPALADGERFETFELTPPVRPAFVPVADPLPSNAIAAPETTDSVHALLNRLERGIARRGESHAAEAPAPGLEEMLESLRRMARA